MKFVISAIVMLLFSSPSFAGQQFKYNHLIPKDYEEMLSEVNKYIAEAQQEAIKYQEQGDDETGDQKAIEKLSEALRLVLSRPDKDNMLSKLMPLIRKELLNYSAYETTLSLTATDAITALQVNKLPVVYRSTAVFILENIIAQLQPLISTNPQMRSIVEKIKNANIKISNDVKTNRKIVSMFETQSPSKTAETALKTHPAKPVSKDEIED